MAEQNLFLAQRAEIMDAVRFPRTVYITITILIFNESRRKYSDISIFLPNQNLGSILVSLYMNLFIRF